MNQKNSLSLSLLYPETETRECNIILQCRDTHQKCWFLNPYQSSAASTVPLTLLGSMDSLTLLGITDYQSYKNVNHLLESVHINKVAQCIITQKIIT
jgi:hypothetical protein